MSARPSALPLPKRQTHLALAEAVFDAAARRAAALRADAGRVDFLFDGVRRGGDVTMEPRTGMRPAPMIPAAGADARAQMGGSAAADQRMK